MENKGPFKKRTENFTTFPTLTHTAQIKLSRVHNAPSRVYLFMHLERRPKVIRRPEMKFCLVKKINSVLL